MNRRGFLTTTMLSGLTLAAFARPARAFSEAKCSDEPGTAVCRELMRHQELLAELDASLAKKGLDPAQRKAVLAAAICPFCGQPLIG